MINTVRLRPAVLTLQAVIVIALVGFVFDLQDHLRWALYTEQFLALVLGACLGLAYLTPQQGAPQDRVPWWDVIAAAVGFGSCLYVAIDYPRLSQLLAERPPAGVALSIVIIALVLEGTRRSSGPSLVWVVLGFVAYALLGHFLPEPFTSRPVDVTRLAVYLGIDSNAMFGSSLMVACGVVATFIVFGQVLMRCGGGDFFTDVATGMMGRYRGGAAKIAVTGSALFGMISGSAVANVAAVGVVTIPMMIRAGFAPQFAAAVEAVGSTGGQLMPPVMGAAAFLMAQMIQAPYVDVAVAAAIPAFLYYLALFIQVDLEAAKRGILGARDARLSGAAKALRDGWFFPLPFALLIVAMLSWNEPAERAALLATALLAALALVVPYKGKRLGFRDLVVAVMSTGSAIVDLVLICAASGLMIGVLNLTGLATELTVQLLIISGNNLIVLLLMTAVVAFILGTGLPTVGVYIILSTLAAPSLIQAGLTPMAAHMFVLYWGMLSMVTPPVALAAFAAANIARTDAWATGWQATWLCWVAFVIPFVFVAAPELLMSGSWLAIALVLAATCIGIWLGSIAMMGHFNRPIGTAQRMVLMTAGLALLLPFDGGARRLWVDLAAIAIAVATFALDQRRTISRQA